MSKAIAYFCFFCAAKKQLTFCTVDVIVDVEFEHDEEAVAVHVVEVVDEEDEDDDNVVVVVCVVVDDNKDKGSTVFLEQPGVVLTTLDKSLDAAAADDVVAVFVLLLHDVCCF